MAVLIGIDQMEPCIDIAACWVAHKLLPLTECTTMEVRQNQKLLTYYRIKGLWILFIIASAPMHLEFI